MKPRSQQVYRKTHAIPSLKFEKQQLSSYGGLVVFQALFQRIGLAGKLRDCVARLRGSQTFSRGVVALALIVHVILGFRRLRDVDLYRDDPLVMRMLGLASLPNVSTISRRLAGMDRRAVENLRGLLRDMVLERLRTSRLARVTLDFDGSVLSTKRHAENTAVGFNKKKKGARSYYPLFCTCAQTGQALDVLFRPGNVHDSHGAADFALACIALVRKALPRAKVEVRMDSAFVSEALIGKLEEAKVEWTVSVPFERFPQLKTMIEGRRRWSRLNDRWSFFESRWKPKSWARKARFPFIRQRVRVQSKEPVQLDLFVPVEHGYEFKVVVTNKTVGARKVLNYHNGRGQQENVFAELKSQAQLDYVPVTAETGNQTYLLCRLFAHNLARELQMNATPSVAATNEVRSPKWTFEQLQTLRNRLVHRAGRLSNCGGILTADDERQRRRQSDDPRLSQDSQARRMSRPAKGSLTKSLQRWGVHSGNSRGNESTSKEPKARASAHRARVTRNRNSGTLERLNVLDEMSFTSLASP